jgi:CBS domain-containing protein
MQPSTAPVIDGGETAEAATEVFERTQKDVVLVRLGPGWSNISRDEVATLIKEGKGGEPIGMTLENRVIPALHPDHPLDMSLRYVDRWQMVPVVNRANLRELEGVITERDVLERYRAFGGE